MADDHEHEPNGDTPLWVRILYRYGVPAGIALFLTYFVTQQYAVDLQSMADSVQSMRGEHQELRFYLRAICINTADSEQERAACVTPNEAR